MTVVFNLWITVTADSNPSLEKFRKYVYRIIWIQGNIWVLNLCLIYHRIYGKKLTSGFSKTRVYLISQIDWRKLVASYNLSSQSLVLMAELLKWETSIDWVLYWSCAKSGSIGKKLVIIQDDLNPILPSLW